ncbi:hypothetical protein BGZ61DRAFT_466062 [Ilyonectria robusta]|uniref:uncharacterized protein n=1 Tax=Ilyonectria robusta TaxID=1079257 RepID=UPI001E8CBEC2|nr:uncharacterized protein BGZ61DRAFT_466062 [Ilyonectria robusta]KAH8657288.1 hypothetical protein BGZ61DRAFT_466062 [Ilyonectria robusta]
MFHPHEAIVIHDTTTHGPTHKDAMASAVNDAPVPLLPQRCTGQGWTGPFRL